MAVDHAREHNAYEVTDLKEKTQLLKALEEENPVLSDEDINRILGDQNESTAEKISD